MQEFHFDDTAPARTFKVSPLEEFEINSEPCYYPSYAPEPSVMQDYHFDNTSKD
jgi:hypothetical protein